MRVDLMKFKPKGLEEFEKFLVRISGGSTDEPPYHILNDHIMSEPLHLSTGSHRINTGQEFNNRLDFGDHLCTFIKTDDDLSKILDDENAGSWLALAYFKAICSRKSGDTWNVREHARYKLEFGGRQKFHRHLVCSVLASYYFHGKNARLFLDGPTHKHPDTMEQIGTREEVMLNKELVKVLDTLYWDVKENKPKVGFQNNNPIPDGAMRRFVGPNSFVEQFGTTYDFWTMDADSIMGILPDEFEKWKTN